MGVYMDNEFDDVSDIAWKMFVATGNINLYELYNKTKVKKDNERR